jgi:flagellar hook-length control protein FliK
LADAVDNKTDTSQSLLTESDQSAVLANPMPVTVPSADIAEQLEGSGAASGLMAGANKPTAVLSREAQAQTVNIEAAASNPDDAGGDFDRSVSAMLARDDANSKSQQDKAALDIKSEAALNQLDDGIDSVESNKTTPGITADISRMNNAMRSETSATVPNNQSALVKHFADPGWNQELGEKLIWMHKQSMPSVELRLNPEHLGPVLVKIDMSQDQATVAFTAQHLAVKDAIEAAIPKLREMMNGQQLNLVEVNVSQQQSDQRQQARDFFRMASEQGQQQRAHADPLSNAAVNEAQDIVDEIEAGRAIATNGLLSLFA